jgi:Flp pilus assembly pilin Flp
MQVLNLARAIGRFLRREEAQDLAEYCLIAALVALVAAVILVRVSGGLQNLWTVANSSVAAGSTAAGNGASSGAH